MKLGSKNSASAPGGYVWEKSGDVIEVPDEFAGELLLIRGAGFYTVGTVVRPFTKAPEPEVETPEDDDPHKLEANHTNDLSDAIEVASPTAKRSKSRK
jgi:hypothetical protein